MVCHAEMFHDYVLSISNYVLSWLLYMMCKFHDDDDYDDESIVKTRTCIVASIVFQDFFFATPPPWKNTALNGCVNQ